MKIAVSVPDEVVDRAERFAKRTGKSRSRLFSDALNEYLARHTPSEITEEMDRVCARLGAKPDRYVAAAARRTLQRSEW